MAPIIIMTLAVADSVHVLVTTLGLMREGKDKLTALRESLRVNFVAVSITSLTTIIGFMALNFSDSPPYWHLGNITAVGILAALLYSMTLLPAMITVLPLRVRWVSGEKKSGVEAVQIAALARVLPTPSATPVPFRKRPGIRPALAAICLLLLTTSATEPLPLR